MLTCEIILLGPESDEEAVSLADYDISMAKLTSWGTADWLA